MMDIFIRRSSIVLFLVFFLFSTQSCFILSLGSMNNNIICKPSERRALLSFKQHLNDSSSNRNSLSSWSGENCCRWAGVVCSNTTTDHHVVQLQLHDLGLGGELNPSLQELKQLRHLDLSWNDFDGIRIPDFLGSLQSLRCLNLSNAKFSGMIPHQLGNLSNLRYLDLSSYFHYPKELSSYSKELTVVGNFQWISHLSSLKHLDLSGVNLENASDFQWISHLTSLQHLDLSYAHLENASDLQWISHLSSLKHLDLSYANLENTSSNWFHDVVNMVPSSLLVLRLRGCGLSGALPTTSPLSHVNFTSLEVLNLSRNKLNSTLLPEWLYSLTNLQQLDLSYNSFQGTISPSIGNLTKLTILDLAGNKFTGEISGILGSLSLSILSIDLSYNQLSGPIPLSIGRLSLLKKLVLSDNKLNGSLPVSLGNLSKLGTLDITENAFEGIVSEVHFANLTNLKLLYMDSVVLKVSPEWIPPFQLSEAYLGTCQLGPGFPIWLRTQKSLTRLGLSRTGISGTIPAWFWNFTISDYFSFDLSYNELHGELPKVINASTSSLKSNQFSGQLPRVTPDVSELYLSNNSFSGPISTLLCNPPSPTSENNHLSILDLSDNLLSGNLTDCWVYWSSSLDSLWLGGNKITGKIPSSMGSLLRLQVLHLGNNRLSGELPSSLRNITSLTSIDFGKNGFTGRLPIWLGESLAGLQYLQLPSNKFYGEIPLELCHLASIQVLDIADNDLRGSIPRCFNNFSLLTTKEHRYGYRMTNFGEDIDKTQLVVKGRELDYYSIGRGLVTSLDLSKNSLSGEIPEELTSLLGLISFNLSWNCFNGKIPEKIGNMSLLESLDFSNNNISGVIPQSISGLSFLSYLNLSYNNLSGEIPHTTQLQGFTNLSFIGNQELCGLPLKNCIGEKPTQKPGYIGDREVEDEDWFEMKWFYMSMGVGFAVGFWAFWGVMVLKRSWRIAYFRFLDDTKDKLCLLF